MQPGCALNPVLEEKISDLDLGSWYQWIRFFVLRKHADVCGLFSIETQFLTWLNVIILKGTNDTANSSIPNQFNKMFYNILWIFTDLNKSGAGSVTSDELRKKTPVKLRYLCLLFRSAGWNIITSSRNTHISVCLRSIEPIYVVTTIHIFIYIYIYINNYIYI